ncbi:stage III sporulation protein AH [Peribacillus deserti]|uniref:Stage III sporulation protein AH n=1 Tax=Peribacillus deserti TaxID=673318 RepID=A0ABS2QJB9_9BACI|nr:SpoIIIAH-like family protein [Peribacillus deserti]MBM7693258.1 stage III sporulation protein AH [Peribacillus deserti]
MLLKKQTVWLLTMLSLVVVLSVYYITTPQKPASDMAVTEEKKKEKPAAKTTTSSDTTKKENADSGKAVTAPANDEVFEAMRMELEDERNKQKEELAVAMTGDISAEEKNAAYEKINSLDDLAVKEGMLESLIVSMNYDGALVRIKGKEVHVLVKSKKQSSTAANEIMNTVSKELGTGTNVAVEFQPEK